MGEVALHWFRKGLRLHDNEALTSAIESCGHVIPLFVLDKHFIDAEKVGSNRMGFILDSLRRLDEDLREKGSQLFVVRGDPLDVVERFIQEFQVDTLTFERCSEPYNRDVDEQMMKMASIHGVKIRATWGQTLYQPEYLLSLNGGKVPATIEHFFKLLSNAAAPHRPIPAPENIPPPPPRLLPNAPPTPEMVHSQTPPQTESPPGSPQMSVLSYIEPPNLVSPQGFPFLPQLAADQTPEPTLPVVSETPEDVVPRIPTRERMGVMDGVPTLQDLQENGYEAAAYTNTWFDAGEKMALNKMEEFFANNKRMFEECGGNDDGTTTTSGNFPEDATSLQCPKTTALSPYLARGSLSVRLLYKRLQENLRAPGSTFKFLLSTVVPCVRRPPSSLEGQLLCREYAYLISYSSSSSDDLGKVGKVAGVPICVCTHIPWVADDRATQLLGKWERGETGYPAVDACMNQLRCDGWMHNKSRHLAASFLTGGDLMVYWELGRNVFEKHLLDADWSINSFQWHWMSCAAFYQQHFTSYDPVDYFKTTDPNGSFIRKYVPALRNFPFEYIYEPWLASKQEQEKAGCVIGVDYPAPIVDHVVVSEENVDKIKKITAELLYFEFD